MCVRCDIVLKRKKCVHQLVTLFNYSEKEVKAITMDPGMAPNHFVMVEDQNLLFVSSLWSSSVVRK